MKDTYTITASKTPNTIIKKTKISDIGVYTNGYIALGYIKSWRVEPDTCFEKLDKIHTLKNEVDIQNVLNEFAQNGVSFYVNKNPKRDPIDIFTKRSEIIQKIHLELESLAPKGERLRCLQECRQHLLTLGNNPEEIEEAIELVVALLEEF
jgi:Zn-finger domain-containing protein